jgi:hypothetical protein
MLSSEAKWPGKPVLAKHLIGEIDTYPPLRIR